MVKPLFFNYTSLVFSTIDASSSFSLSDNSIVVMVCVLNFRLSVFFNSKTLCVFQIQLPDFSKSCLTLWRPAAFRDFRKNA